MCELRGRVAKARGIALFERGAVRHLLCRLQQPARPEVCLAAGVGHQDPAVSTVRERLRRLLPLRINLLEPRERIGVALDLAVLLEHKRRERAVVTPRAERLGQQLPLRVARLEPGVKRLHHPLEHALTQQLRLLLVEHAEVRRQRVLPVAGEQMHVLPQHGGTERVHRLDVRLIDTEELAAQVAALRVHGHAARELGGDLPAQLRRRRLRIGDDEEVVHIAALTLHIREQPLDEHLRFAGARRRRDKQAPAAVIDRGLLRLRQLDFSHAVPPPSPAR